MIFKSATICEANGERVCDVRVEDGIIAEIGTDIKGENIVDAKGCYLLPLLVDINIKTPDSNLNAKNIKIVSTEALAGGIGHIVLNPDSTPAIDNEIVLEFAQNGLHELRGAKVDLMINTLKEDTTLSNIAILLKRGAISPYMSTIAKNDVAIKIAQYAQMYGVTIFCKAEDNSLISSGVMLDGDVSSKLGLAGIPDLSEVLHVSRMIEIARHFKIKILFKAIASPRSIYLINKAKSEGVNVTCEVSIHHILNSDESCKGFNTTAKLNPPLASKTDMLLLQEALKNSQIDILTTLHQPSSPLRKEVAFYDAAYGCDGLLHAMSLYYTKLVKSKMITMSRLLELCVINPLQAIGQDGSEIKVGAKASFMLFDPNKKVIIDEKLSLYNGEELYGEIREVFND
ncbi:dihydroorotase [Sulfurimonas denitrificans DSM 1251]|uniref:Dihydroorotase n=1 Tax=Sulfurimonas denitrificans (strain ATCC 33889 / DSM 1251) TaxID=326298 RepID=Q30S48_SULDN|nr:metal-dependent hydrolase [Sulfurimonas denitrificans]ABB44183.1 dihydroorotase [Sulfurimonas denitrificans DSM 1251]MDD3441808.1 metal-dependent hydrolase [Sulfurimonas denitrificans]